MNSIQKVAGCLGRSLSFTLPNAVGAGDCLGGNPRSSYQQRSVSLPARLLPLVPHLENEISGLRAWHSGVGAGGGGKYGHLPITGLDLRRHVWHRPPPLLPLRPPPTPPISRLPPAPLPMDRPTPQRLPPLRRRPWRLPRLPSSPQEPPRRLQRRTPARRRRRMASAAQEQRKTEKELLKLASTVRTIGKAPPPPLMAVDSLEAELAEIAREVTVLTATASTEVFAGITSVLRLPSTALTESEIAVGGGRAEVVVVGVWEEGEERRRGEKAKEDVDKNGDDGDELCALGGLEPAAFS